MSQYTTPTTNAKPLRPVGEIIAWFPQADLDDLLLSFDWYAQSEIRIVQATMAYDAPLALGFPPQAPLRFLEWLRDNEVRFITAKKVGARRAHRRQVRYKIILGIEEGRHERATV